MNKTPTVLIIMDGFGMGAPGPGNAVYLANTPVLDRLFADNAHTTLSACTPLLNEIFHHAARAAGVEAFDTPFTDVNDDGGLWEDARYAKSLGFTGKASISPRHVPGINAVFSPTQAEIAYAQEVLAAIDEAKRQGRGAISLHGKMIDAPIVTRARQTLASAQILGLIGGETHGN